jgi:hypothetical protein
VNDVGKPCAGEPHARFDRGLLAKQRPWRVGHHTPDGKRSGLRLATDRLLINQRPTLPAYPKKSRNMAVVAAARKLVTSDELRRLRIRSGGARRPTGCPRTKTDTEPPGGTRTTKALAMPYAAAEPSPPVC